MGCREKPDPPKYPDPKALEDAVKSLEGGFAFIQKLWEILEPQKELFEFLQYFDEHVLPKGNVVIDSALCLGLGSFRYDRLEEWNIEEITPGRDFFVHGNSFFQLVFFEAVINHLKKFFDIKEVAFQDPDFSAADVAILERRGHTVIPYPESEFVNFTEYYGPTLDPAIRQRFSSTTFLFAPSLLHTVSIQLAQALKPKLYLGNDFAAFTRGPRQRNPGNPIAPYLEEVDTLMWSYMTWPMEVLGEIISFHWLGDSDDDVLRDTVYSNLIFHARKSHSLEWVALREQRALEKKLKKAEPKEALKMLDLKYSRLRLDDVFKTYWRKRLEKAISEEAKHKDQEKVKNEKEKKSA